MHILVLFVLLATSFMPMDIQEPGIHCEVAWDSGFSSWELLLPEAHFYFEHLPRLYVPHEGVNLQGPTTELISGHTYIVCAESEVWKREPTALYVQEEYYPNNYVIWAEQVWVYDISFAYRMVNWQ